MVALTRLTSRPAVLQAIAEFDRKGQPRFLDDHGYGSAHSYILLHAGKEYDSKAIVGVAWGNQYPDEGPLKPQDFSGGEARVRKILERLGFTVKRRQFGQTSKPSVQAIKEERSRRQRLWKTLESLGGPYNVTSSTIGESGIRPAHTGQGIFRDIRNTVVLAPQGVTLCLLDRGSRYQDEFDEEGGIYHYPSTKRGDRDAQEIAATKNANFLKIPIFVVLPGGGSGTFQVRKAWVTDSSDKTKQFLISFIEQSPVPSTTAPFQMFRPKAGPVKKALALTRPGQRKFRFAVAARTGERCALCSVDVRILLDAAHVVPVKDRGSDHPENGIMLCANHHRAFDEGLVAIDPYSLRIHVRPTAGSIRIENTVLVGLPPHRDALLWRWNWLGKSSGWPTAM